MTIDIFNKMMQFPNADITTNEFSKTAEDWKVCKIESFDVVNKLVNVFHPVNGKIHSLNPSEFDGFLVLKRLEELSEDECIELTHIATGWNKDYLYLAGRDKERIIIQSTIIEYKEFNIGLGINNAMIWIMNIGSSELNQIKSYPSAIQYLYENNYGFDYMFDEQSSFATEEKDLTPQK